jgi:hypothetical protein
MGRGWFGPETVDEAFNALSHTQNLAVPKGRFEHRLLKYYLGHATVHKRLRFYVGSCPDYSHNGQIYTHENVGRGVPLLTRFHLDVETPLLRELTRLDIPYEYVIIVADVEAVDEVFCRRFTGGDEREFLLRCDSSVGATRFEMINLKLQYYLDGFLRSSSFFTEFGRDRFIDLQEGYKTVLAERYREDPSFNGNVARDLFARQNLYRKMYPDVFGSGVGEAERTDFLVGRTLRTMAQYLTLGRLISAEADSCFPVIIGHPTRNLGMFNGRNRFHLSEDGGRQQPVVPVFEMKRRVYS